MSKIKQGIQKSIEHKLNSLANPSKIKIEVTDLTNNETTIYHSMREAVKVLGINVSNINNFFT